MSGRADAVMSYLAITDERRARYAFTRPYYRAPLVFIARRDDRPTPGEAVLSPEALGEARIGVERNSDAATLLEERFPNVRIVAFGAQREAALDLAAGRLDFVLGERAPFEAWLKREPEALCCLIAGRAPDAPDVLGEGFAIGVRPDRKELVTAIDAALAAIMSDGTYAVIARRHFGFDPR